VLMDVQMPVMDGLTATRLLRQEDAFRELPVVAMTANAMMGDRDRCLAAGMNDHIAKPIEPEDLWSVLLKWIKPGPALGAPAAPSAATPPLAPIEGLDMAAALRRVLGKEALFVSMLRKFIAGQASAPAGILGALEGEDWTTAERIAHTLKGVSGNIGATDLQARAEVLETAIRERQPLLGIRALLHGLEGPLETLVARLREALPVVAARTAVPVDPDRLRTVCAQLAGLLAQDDGEAGDVLEAHADLLCAAFPDRFGSLEESIRAFDFEGALATLNAASGAGR